MPEPLSDARLDEIRASYPLNDIGFWDEDDAIAAFEAVQDLLGEVDRLREQADVVTAVRECVAKAKRSALRLTACIAATAAVWIALEHLLPGPWNFIAAIPVWCAAGWLLGTCEFWIEERLEARRD